MIKVDSLHEATTGKLFKIGNMTAALLRLQDYNRQSLSVGIAQGIPCIAS